MTEQEKKISELETENTLLKEEVEKLKDGEEIAEIEKFVNEQHAEAIYHDGKLVGCVKRAQ